MLIQVIRELVIAVTILREDANRRADARISEARADAILAAAIREYVLREAKVREDKIRADAVREVKRILGEGIEDPSLHRNEALDLAVSNGETEIVRFLLRDPRVNPNDRDFQFVRVAAVAGYVEIISLFIFRAKKGSLEIEATIQACRDADENSQVAGPGDEERRRVANVKEIILLLENFHQQYFIDACIEDRIDVVRTLLAARFSDGRPMLSTGYVNHGLGMAASGRGRIDIVRLLLADPRVNPREGLRDARNPEIIRILREFIATNHLQVGGTRKKSRKNRKSRKSRK